MSHDSPLSNDLPPKPEPWRPQVKGWVYTAGYNGPVRSQKQQIPADEAMRRAAEAVAARRRNGHGSFVEAAAQLAAANAANRKRQRVSS